jgi:hypothetical protein
MVSYRTVCWSRLKRRMMTRCQRKRGKLCHCLDYMLTFNSRSDNRLISCYNILLSSVKGLGPLLEDFCKVSEYKKTIGEVSDQEDLPRRLMEMLAATVSASRSLIWLIELLDWRRCCRCSSRRHIQTLQRYSHAAPSQYQTSLLDNVASFSQERTWLQAQEHCSLPLPSKVPSRIRRGPQEVST